MEFDHNGTSSPLGIYIYHAGFESAFRNDGLHLLCDIVQAVMCGGADLDVSLHIIYHCRGKRNY